MDKLDELLVAQIKELFELNATEGKGAERSLLLELGGNLGWREYFSVGERKKGSLRCESSTASTPKRKRQTPRVLFHYPMLKYSEAHPHQIKESRKKLGFSVFTEALKKVAPALNTLIYSR